MLSTFMSDEDVQVEGKIGHIETDNLFLELPEEDISNTSTNVSKNPREKICLGLTFEVGSGNNLGFLNVEMNSDNARLLAAQLLMAAESDDDEQWLSETASVDEGLLSRIEDWDTDN